MAIYRPTIVEPGRGPLWTVEMYLLLFVGKIMGKAF
jgi:hypothetical protein